MSDSAAIEDTDTAVPTPVEEAPRSIFKYSRWLHVGEGAEDCPDAESGTCTEVEHFHAWLRLPNDLQQRDIRERALAAKARKVRQLRQQGTDSNEILESSIEDLRAEPDFKALAVEELVGKDWAADYLQAIGQARLVDDPSEDAEEGAKLYATIEDDKQRLLRLSTMSEDERSADEWDELNQHVANWQAEVERQLDEIIAPKRASLMTLDEDALADVLRRERVKAQGSDAFSYAYRTHEALSCTYDRQSPSTRKLRYKDLAHLEAEEPAVLADLIDAFNGLEREATESAGNF